MSRRGGGEERERERERERETQLVDDNLSSYSVQSVSSFRRHGHCIVGKKMDFSDLKNKHKRG